MAVLHEVGETAGALHDVADHCPVVLHFVVALHDVDNCPALHFVALHDVEDCPVLWSVGPWPVAVLHKVGETAGALHDHCPVVVHIVVALHDVDNCPVLHFVALHDVEDCPVLCSVGLLRPVVLS